MRGSRTDARRRRHFRVRKKVYGTSKRPRLAVFRSNRHIYAQVINDDAGVTSVDGLLAEAVTARAKSVDS